MNATVMPRQEAQEAFNDAIIRGVSTALLEQDTPEIFTSSLGNIPPNTRLKTKITFITLLKHRFDNERKITTFTIPTCIAGRYGEAPQEFQGATSTDVLDRVASRQAAENFEDLADETPKPTTSITLIKLKDGSTFLDRDFVLDIESFFQDGLEKPKAWLEIHPTLANHQALMVTIPPNFFMRDAENESGSEVLFLADRSGSMADKIDTLKSALRFFIKGIPLGKTFNIWSFGSSYLSMWPKSMDYTEENVRQALEHIDAFDSNMGGTELLAALEAIIRSKDTLNPCDIIILTDGEVWRLDQTLNLVQRTRTYSQGLVRFFSLGIGCTVSHALIEGIAKSGGGYSEVISSVSQGGWEDRVVAMLKAALTRHVGSLEIDMGSQCKPYGESTSPADLRYLDPFQNNRVFALFDDATRLTERGFIELKSRTTDGSQLSQSVPIHVTEKKDTTLHGLAGRAILEDLERGRSKVHLSAARPQPGSYEEQRLIRTEAEAIACRGQTVRNLLAFQRFDGSFDIKDEEAEEAVGKEVARVICSATEKVHALANERLRMLRTTAAVYRRLAATAMILLFLEKDYQDCKDLWELMWSKGMAYIRAHLPTGLDETMFFNKLKENDEGEDDGKDDSIAGKNRLQDCDSNSSLVEEVENDST
ncbi:hypothetical protein DL770_006665 [Monosporascus sp. CRB-9-2]|nr:hypothetical protein DL770_006665 [Monosporascus sp. CRB-9-2]